MQPKQMYSENASTTLPPLRQDLEIIRGGSHHTGEPSWMLFDPIRNQYYRIGRVFFTILSCWKLVTLERVKHAANTRLKRPIGDEDVAKVLEFLFDNQLTKVPPKDGYKSYLQKEHARRKGLMASALHGYLFFKIPLFRPTKFLNIAWPIFQCLFTKSSAIFFVFTAVLGLYLVSRQWSFFEAQFVDFLSFEGFIFYALSLVFVKTCHELGHAFMAHKFGLKVPIIGVAFLVLMPILYTDTSDAWKLRSRRQKLLIDCAGILTELALASIATLAWVFLPDGLMRSAAFSVAAVSWILSLLVNLNPFMRFDGYYILSDALGVENLQARGFALGRWKLRELLFRLHVPPPERIRLSLRRVLIAHAWGTWLYRFFLFLGIALLVYSFFIKVVAIALFLIEIFYFIMLPILRELKIWWGIRTMIMKSKRSYFSATLVIIVGSLFFFPISKTVAIDAVVHSQDDLRVFPPSAGKLEVLNVENGKLVERGQALARISSIDLQLKIELTKRKVSLLEKRLNRSNVDVFEKSNLRVLQSELSGEHAELKSLLHQQDKLTITAERHGMIVDLDPAMHLGRHVSQTEAMFTIKSHQGLELTGAISEKNVDRISIGGLGTFYPDNAQLPSIQVELKSIKDTSMQSLSFADIAQTHGGSVPVEPDQNSSGALKVAGSYYALRLDALTSCDRCKQTQRGIVKLEAQRVSYAQLTFARIVSVLRRESGF